MDKPKLVLVSPEGIRIRGTFEHLCGCAAISNPGDIRRAADGTYEFDYQGDTEIYWDDQETAHRRGERVCIDEEGNQFRESELRLVPEDPENEE